MKHTWTTEAILITGFAAIMLCLVAANFCRFLEQVKSFNELKSLSVIEKLYLASTVVVMIILLNLMTVSSPSPNWSILALAMFSAGMITELVSMVTLKIHWTTALGPCPSRWRASTWPPSLAAWS